MGIREEVRIRPRQHQEGHQEIDQHHDDERKGRRQDAWWNGRDLPMVDLRRVEFVRDHGSLAH